jgi:hypothetical protein
MIPENNTDSTPNLWDDTLMFYLFALCTLHLF